MNLTYTPIDRCSSVWTWLLCEWDIRKRWEGPARLIREVGIRVLGVEITWERVQR